MAYTYDELKGKTIGELREIAKDVDHEVVKGYSQMNKEHLLPALVQALGIHEHHEVRGIDKPAIKGRIRTLKAEKQKALEAQDHERLKALRRQIHRLNHQIRAHMT
jgi:protein-arginine kinase activator protein McsA